jgi:hypothetical protein
VHSHAFDQGSYFIFDIVESAESEPIKGRLAVPAEALARVDSESAQVAVERSEFEIDFHQPIQSGEANSAFDLNTPVQTTADGENISFSTDSFDFGSSNTVFGE